MDTKKTPPAPPAEKGIKAKITRLVSRVKALLDYYNNGVWLDTSRSWKVTLVRTVNLTARGFTDGSLQNRACAMTYRTVLAIVPMLALLLAIGRGFGLQDYLQKELFDLFPSNQRLLSMSFNWVDSYLSKASEGLFVGIGILFLLWTLISLLSNVEEIFNMIWNVKAQRSLWRKVSDYVAILLILPVLMICSSGIQIFMSSALQSILDYEIFGGLASLLLDFASIALSWLFFAGCYAWIPNARVKLVNALIAGVLAGTGYQVLQWLFVSGQMYVAKYNAIYGSFSFLPLLLIWLQLVWLITFIGARVCYSLENTFTYSFEQQITNISPRYRLKAAIAVLTIIVKRFAGQRAPMTSAEISEQYEIPPRLLESILVQLTSAGMICHVIKNKLPDTPEILPYQPTMPPADYTLGAVLRRLEDHGAHDFIPGFSDNFAIVGRDIDMLLDDAIDRGNDIALSELDIMPNLCNNEKQC